MIQNYSKYVQTFFPLRKKKKKGNRKNEKKTKKRLSTGSKLEEVRWRVLVITKKKKRAHARGEVIHTCEGTWAKLGCHWRVRRRDQKAKDSRPFVVEAWVSLYLPGTSCFFIFGNLSSELFQILIFAPLVFLYEKFWGNCINIFAFIFIFKYRCNLFKFKFLYLIF